ncbi:MAG TPA: putative baseplate assembly protein, partial [Thermoanaerobaculia bacterium]|jgi:hypothetical protein|nr:putative baseplate assembly protein [Thermoanaerobaculia bacterium]
VEVGEKPGELTLFFLRKAPKSIQPENIVIAGCSPGARKVKVERVHLCRLKNPDRDDCLHLYLDRPGDFSRYSLCLRELDKEGRPTEEPLHGFDPRYACLPVDFKIGCPSDLDCQAERSCPPEPREEPEINYLAKDYASFRQLLLDRLALTMPDWRERHVPDLGIALVEVLAYVGDHLSYYQDAVATEAYLGTARRRISVRRHVRLVDYPMHEGVNARTWVCVETTEDWTLKADRFSCITGLASALPPGQPLTADDLRNVPGEQYEVFLPVVADPQAEIVLFAAHNEIQLYTWGDRECCLPRGATRATLADTWVPGKKPGRRLQLQVGDLLLFEEVLGPKTGNPADADPAHRQVVRLTRVTPGVDKLYDPDKKPQGRPFLEVEWALPDALPFPLCLSSIGPAPNCALLTGVSVARGNLFLADHGRTVAEPLGSVPAAESPPRCLGEGEAAEVTETAGPFNPALKQGPLTFRQPLPAHAERLPAAGLLDQDPRQALPAVTLAAVPAPQAGAAWSARRDLLESGPDDPSFVVEVDDDGRGHLRFGDGELGAALRPGTAFTATYRVGNGPAGNIGAESLRHLVLADQLAVSGLRLVPRNPLPARGGTAPEPLAEVRLLAPHVFRQRLERAITADDYARIVERDFAGRVQRAAANLGWTGSWTAVVVAVDPLAAVADVDGLLAEIRRALQRYRRIGHDLVVRRAVTVPLEVRLAVCVRPHYLRGHVEADLLAVLGTGTLPEGRRGFFHPDNLTFGQGIALSRLVAAAQAVTGVESVRVAAFHRLHHRPNHEIANGFLPLSPLEIARLDNDPRSPGNGRLRLDLRGGR